MHTAAEGKRVAARLRELRDQVRSDPKNDEALDEIIGTLNGDWYFSRQYAAGILGELGPLAKRAIPDLVRALNCGEGVVEREAAIALGSVAVGVPDAVEPLRQKMREFKSDAAWFAADSLGDIGQAAVVAIPDLETAARSPVSNMAASANRALAKLRPLQRAARE
jgi:HEAT repeat protein